MKYLGKIIGGLAGMIFFGPFGALIGLLAGHFYDLYLHNSAKHRTRGVFAEAFDRVRAQQTFFRVTFEVMGYIAKANGHVSEAEIRHAEQIMTSLGLNPTQRRQAIHYFSLGKQADFNLDKALQLLSTNCRQQRNLLQLFIEIQFQIARADSSIGPDEKQLLQHLCQQLGFDQIAFESFFERYGSGQRQRQQRSQQTAQNTLADSYRTLGVDEATPDADVKKAYRRLMAQHHPDKLVAKGLPESMMKVATEKTQKIKAAYDQVRAARGIR